MGGHADTRASSAWRPVGRYEMGPRIAIGGMAELYLARTSGVHGFQKYSVIKRILPRWADDREFVEMFLDEARLAAQLDHPNVAHVHDIGEDDDGPFFAMEYIHGEHLLAIMRRCQERDVPMDWGAFVALGSAAAAGLHHAHERRGFDGRPLGIIHRDVSPTNVLVTYEGAVKVVDFGIAKAASSRHSTRPSVRKGKMAYMSPEQCRGDAVDRRSDVFALGVVLYELATLTRAFAGDSEFAVMNCIVNHDIEPASARRSDIPKAIDRVLARALHRDCELRYGSARELQRDLDAYAAEAGIAATPVVLATMMEALFGTPPYPWEAGADREVDEPARGERSQPTVVKPPRDELSMTRKASPRRGRWIAAVLGAAVLVSLGWVASAARREAFTAAPALMQDAVVDEAPRMPVLDEAPLAPVLDEAPRTPAIAIEPSATASPISTAVPRRSPTKSSARPRTKTPPAEPPPAAPTPFDPDAPAPRPR